jgi:hypothetical protein
MRAIQLLGSGPVVPASSVEDFVAALIDADIATGAWHIDATWPEPPASAPASRPVDRVGGCVHKVIRWAFEQQGLYARVAEHEVFEGRGAPPEVDLYIRDRRPGEAGGYAPVPLKVGGGQTPLWHSDDRGVEWRPPHVVVHVHNRGDRPATNVKLRCWVQAQGGTHPWIRLADPTGPSTVPPGSTAPTDFSFAQVDANGAPLMLSGDHLVKAEVSCTEDPSNIDASTGLPPSYIDVDPLFHLVANDNNLALRGLRFP